MFVNANSSKKQMISLDVLQKFVRNHDLCIRYNKIICSLMQNHETQSSITTKCTHSIDELCEKDYVHFNKVVILCEIDLMIEG